MVSAFFFALALALATRFGRFPHQKQKLSRQKGFWVPFHLNLGLAFALGGIFYTRSFTFDPVLTASFAVLVVVLTLAFRFPRSAGLPLVALAAALATLGVWLLVDHRPLDPERPLIRARLLSESETVWKLETGPQPAAIHDLRPGEWFPPSVSYYRTPGLLGLTGGSLWYLLGPEPRDDLSFVRGLLAAWGWAGSLSPGLPEHPKLYHVYELWMGTPAGEQTQWREVEIGAPF